MPDSTEEEKEEVDDEEEEDQSNGSTTQELEEDFVTLGDLDEDRNKEKDDNRPRKDASEEEDDDDEDDDDMEEENMDGSKKNRKRKRKRTYDRERDLPPWMLHHVDRRHKTNPMVALHNEIVGFCHLMEPRQEEMIQRNELVQRFKALAESIFTEGCQVEVFGSQATGLCLPNSDIDIVIQLEGEGGGDNNEVMKEVGGEKGMGGDTKSGERRKVSREQELKDMENWNAPSGTPLERLAEGLREEWYDDLIYLEVIPNTRVPLVKFTHGPTKIQIDVCFNQKTGVQAAQLMHRYMDALPPLRPLTFVLKYFLSSRGLNQPYSGGMGSFMLQMMIVSFLQHRAREFSYNRMPINYNLGALLMDFLELYSMDFNFITVGVSVRFDGYYFPKGASDRKGDFWQIERPFSFAMENPLDPKMDVGAPSFRVSWIQRAFEIALKVVLCHVTEPMQPSVSILASILPPTEEMFQRIPLLLLSSRNPKDVGLTAGRDQTKRPSKVSSPPRKRQRR